MYKSRFLNALIDYCGRAGVAWEYVDKLNKRVVRVQNSRGVWKNFGSHPIALWPGNNYSASTIVKDKDLSLRLCAEAGVRVPHFAVGMYDMSIYDHLKNKPPSAKIVGENFPFEDMVVKPNDASCARGLSFIYGKHNLGAAIEAAGAYCQIILFQQMVRGEDVRYYVFKGEPVLKISRPPNTKSDGFSGPEEELSAASFRMAVDGGADLAGRSPYPVGNFSVSAAQGILSDSFSPEEKELAAKIYGIFGLTFFALDCLVGEETYVLEINNNPGVEMVFGNTDDPASRSYFDKLVFLNLEDC